MRHRFTRQELFDLLWSRPIRDIASEFGISDVALAKSCRGKGIPLPGRGYWAKISAGAKVVREPLPPRGLGVAETIEFHSPTCVDREEENALLILEEIPPPPEFPESLEALTARVQKLLGKVAYVRDLKRTHAVVAKLLDDDVKREEKRAASAYPAYDEQAYFSAPFEQRRLKILNSIFLALAKLGMSSSARGKNPSEFAVSVAGGTTLSFRLDSPRRKSQHRQEDWRQVSDARRPASDPLQLSIDWYRDDEPGIRLTWDDSRDAPIEQSVQEIAVGLAVAAEMQVRAAERHAYAWRVERKSELIEAARRHEEEVMERDRLRRLRLDRARIEQLLEDAMRLRLANDLREYIQLVRQTDAALPDSVPPDELAQWVSWASEQVRLIDPILTRSYRAPVEDPGESPKQHGRPSTTPESSEDPASRHAWHPNLWYTLLHR